MQKMHEKWLSMQSLLKTQRRIRASEDIFKRSSLRSKTFLATRKNSKANIGSKLKEINQQHLNQTHHEIA